MPRLPCRLTTQWAIFSHVPHIQRTWPRLIYVTPLQVAQFLAGLPQFLDLVLLQVYLNSFPSYTSLPAWVPCYFGPGRDHFIISFHLSVIRILTPPLHNNRELFPAIQENIHFPDNPRKLKFFRIIRDGNWYRLKFYRSKGPWLVSLQSEKLPISRKITVDNPEYHETIVTKKAKMKLFFYSSLCILIFKILIRFSFPSAVTRKLQ